MDSLLAATHPLPNEGSVQALPSGLAATLAPLNLAKTPQVAVQGARLHALTEQACVRLILDELDGQRGGTIITLNLDHLRRYVADADYARCCDQATLRLADGMPLVWASRIQGTPLPERVTGSNLVWSLSEGAARQGKSVFLLGGRPGAAEATAERLSSCYPALRVVGTYCPPYGFETDMAELERLGQALTAAQPDIVYLALGSPKPEWLMAEVADCLPHAWWLVVGIAFSFVAGDIPRAPLWMQRCGLEWLHRLAHEPRRLAKRYLWHGIPFALRLFASALLRRLQGPC